MFHVEQKGKENVPRGTERKRKCSTWNRMEKPFIKNKMFHVEQKGKENDTRGI